MNRLLVATDLSARSDRAVHRALAIAHEKLAAVEIIHVVDDAGPQSLIERQAEQARGAIADQVQSLMTGSDVNVATIILRGQAYVEIVKRATETGADLVVLGIHRHKGREMFRGTTAERIIRLGHTPVLVVTGPVSRAYGRVLVGYDFSIHSQRALEYAAELLPHATFEIVHATHVPFKGLLGRETQAEIAKAEEHKSALQLNEDLQRLHGKLGKTSQRFSIAIEEGSPTAVICRKVRQTQPDLVVVGTHGRSGLSHLVLGSVAEDLLANATVDILTVKA